MDIYAMQQATREAVKKKFGRKRYITSKVVPHYPQNIEREYVRIMNAYMKTFKSVLAAHIPDIRALFERRGAVRTDAAGDENFIEESEAARFITAPTAAEIMAITTAINLIFAGIAKDLAERQGAGSLSQTLKALDKIIKQQGKYSISEWKRVVKRTLGIDIMGDYYNGVKFQQILDKWVAANVGLIKTIPQETLGKMREIVMRGYINGTPTMARDFTVKRKLKDGTIKTVTLKSNQKSIADQIQEAYGVSKSRAELIARDQMAKLNARITQEQQKDAGVSEYIWRTVNDSRVRTRHRQLNGTKQKYSAPPIMDDGAGKNPGEDYQCFLGSSKINLTNGGNEFWRRWYSGIIVELRLADGSLLQATPNHPALTPNGWLPLNTLQEGDYLVQGELDGGDIAKNYNGEFVPTFADCFDALSRFCRIVKTAGTKSDFHGDGTETDIYIVSAESLLSNYFKSEFFKPFREFFFTGTCSDIGNARFCASSFCEKRRSIIGNSPNLVCVANKFFAFLDRKLAHSDRIGFTDCSSGDIIIPQYSLDNASVDRIRLRQGKFAFAADVPRDYLVLWQLLLHRLFPVRINDDILLTKVPHKSLMLARDACGNGSDSFAFDVYSFCQIKEKRLLPFAGHVYNLQNVNHWYSITHNGTNASTVFHNCRCVALPVFDIESVVLPWQSGEDLNFTYTNDLKKGG